jgi:hypothetical protein
MVQALLAYAIEDAAVASSIAHALESRRIDVALQPLPPAGTALTDDARTRLARAHCLVLLWSRAAAQSGFVSHDLAQAIGAWSQGRLVIATVDETELPRGMRDLHAIAIRGGVDVPDSLLESVLDLVRPMAAAATEPPMPYIPPPPTAPAAEPPQWAASAGAPQLAASRGAGRIGLAVLAVAAGAILIGAAWLFLLSVQPETSAPPPLGPPNGISDTGRSSTELVIYAALLSGLAGAGLVFALTWRARRRQAPAPTRTQTMASPAAPQPRPNATPAPAPASSPSATAPMPAAPPANAPAIFVSYSRQDGQTVEQLVAQIEKAGYTVWIDRQSTGSQRYAAPIVRAIRTSKLVALMCSRHAFESDHVIREVYVAGDYKKPFIAFQLDPSEFPDEVLYFVSGFPRIPVAALDPSQLRSELARLVTV